MNVVEICAKCGGSGWKIVERGGLSGPERCECADEGGEQRILERANIPPLYRNASVDPIKQNFRVPEDSSAERVKNLVWEVQTYITDFPYKVAKPGLIFIGPPGTGKTHLAVAALRGLIAKGHEGIFFDFQTLLNQIRSGYDQASGSMDREAYRTALDAEILVLDDLGAHRITDWVEDTVTSIITHRCNNRKATIATTNLDKNVRGDQSPAAADIYSKYSLAERIGMRAYSRLFEMCKVIEMPEVEDYRLKKR